MNILVDEEKFEEYQEEMLHYLAKIIKRLLEEKEVPEELIYDLTGDLVFEIGTIIDSSTVMGTEENPVLPYLTFSKNDSNRESLIAGPNGSYLHEMAFRFVDQIFEEDE